MKYQNIWIASILAISILAGVWIYTVNTRFELSSPEPSGAVYIIDRITGQVRLIAGDQELEIKSVTQQKAEKEAEQFLQKFNRKLKEFEK